MLTKKDFMLCQSTTEQDAGKLDTGKWRANYKFDGERIIAIVQNKEVILLNRRGLIKNAQFQEVAQELSNLPNCILDGEVISKDNNFNKLQSRAGTENAKKLIELQKSIPIDYMIFDILTSGNNSLTNKPLSERLIVLNNLFSNTQFNNIALCEYGDISNMLNIAKQKQMEGIIIKNLNATYQAKRSWDWLKLKLWKEAEISITTYTCNNAGIRVEDSQGNAVQIAGSQSYPIKQMLDSGREVNIYVQYLEKTPNGRMRFPSFRGVKNDN